MAKNKKHWDKFADLTWNVLDKWAGNKIVSRGRSYQKQGRVSELAQTENGELIAWVYGTEKYATKVNMDESGQPDSTCTCPYSLDCKHGVAVVLEYLSCIQDKRSVPQAIEDDERFELLALEDELWNDNDYVDDNTLPGDDISEIDSFIRSKTKAQLIELVQDLAKQYSDVRQNLSDRLNITSGNVNTMVTRLRKDILEVGSERDWQNHWQDEGFTPDYSRVHTGLEKLLKAGYADEALSLGNELLTAGIRQVEESHDDGETAMEIAEIMPVIVKALKQSSLDTIDKLLWAVDSVLKDQFGFCEAIDQYLMEDHKKSDWSLLADALLKQLKKLKHSIEGTNTWSRKYHRDRLSDWIIHALEQAEREDEIIPLCEAEAKKTESYERLTKRLITAKRYKDAERWIQEGLRVTSKQAPGTAKILRLQLCEIRIGQKDWSALAAIQVEEFVRYPSQNTFTECKKTSGKVKAWSRVRKFLMIYLESGMLPWKQKGWNLPKTGLDASETARKNSFPMLSHLIEIAILENKPDQVLHWYDQCSKKQFAYRIDENKIATAIVDYAPDRAVVIWTNKAERMIAQVKPSAYQEAGNYLRKASVIMARENKQKQWDQYLQALRQEHIRKIRLIEVLDGLDGKPIVEQKRKNK